MSISNIYSVSISTFNISTIDLKLFYISIFKLKIANIHIFGTFTQLKIIINNLESIQNKLRLHLHKSFFLQSTNLLNLLVKMYILNYANTLHLSKIWLTLRKSQANNNLNLILSIRYKMQTQIKSRRRNHLVKQAYINKTKNLVLTKLLSI